MMTETVIKWARPQMVGNYYEPYIFDMADAMQALEDVYANRRTLGFSRKAHYAEVARIVDEMERGQYE